MDVTGLALVLRHLTDLGAVAALLAVCTVVGLEVLARLRVRYDAPLEALLFGVSLGAGVVATVLLGLGLAGLLGSAAPLLVVLACAGIGARQWRLLPGFLLGALRALVGRGGRARVAILTASGAAACFVLLLAIAPPVDWDSLMYHLRVPAQFLEQGRIFLPEDNLHVAFVGLWHMLYLPLLLVGSASAPAVLNAAMTIALSLAMFALASRFWGESYGAASLLLLWTSPIVLLVGGTARIDVTLAVFLLLAQYALLLALRRAGDPGNVYVAALLAGIALAAKHQALLYDAALTPLAFAAVRSQTPNLRQAAAKLTWCLALAIGVALPFLAKNALLLGAPLYPFFAPPALEPWLVPLFHQNTVPPGAAAGAFHALAHVREPFNLGDAFLHPGRLTIEKEGAFYYATPVFLVLLLWPALRRDRTLSWLGLPAVGYLVILLGAFPRTNLRYLIPAIAPLTVAAGVIAVSLGQRRLPRWALAAAGVLLAVLALGPSLRTASAWLFRTRLVAYALGRTSADAFLATDGASGFSGYSRTVRFVNDSLPPDSRVLELFEGRGYSFDRTVLADPRLTNWPLLAGTSAPDDCLRSLGVTHVLIGAASIDTYVSRGLSRDAVRLEALERFIARCLRPVHIVSGLPLYRVAPPPVEASNPQATTRRADPRAGDAKAMIRASPLQP